MTDARQLIPGSEVMLRFFLQLAVTAAGFFVFTVMSRSPDVLIALFIPFVLAVPGIIVILLVFIPIELAGARRGRRGIALISIPFVSAAVPWMLFPLAGNLQNFVTGAAGLSAIGFLWGLGWVITRLLYVLFRPRPDTPT